MQITNKFQIRYLYNFWRSFIAGQDESCIHSGAKIVKNIFANSAIDENPSLASLICNLFSDFSLVLRQQIQKIGQSSILCANTNASQNAHRTLMQLNVCVWFYNLSIHQLIRPFKKRCLSSLRTQILAQKYVAGHYFCPVKHFGVGVLTYYYTMQQVKSYAIIISTTSTPCSNIQ